MTPVDSKGGDRVSAKQPDRPCFEASDVRARFVAYAGVALFATVAVCFGVVAAIVFLTTPETPSPPSVLDTVIAKSGPRLEVDPQSDRRGLQAKAQARIDSYGWVNRDAGTARIPIEQAMALVAMRGWPDSQPVSTDPNGDGAAR